MFFLFCQYPYTGCQKSTKTPRYILNVLRYQHFIPPPNILQYFMFFMRDENFSPRFLRDLKWGNFNIFDSSSYLVTLLEYLRTNKVNNSFRRCLNISGQNGTLTKLTSRPNLTAYRFGQNLRTCLWTALSFVFFYLTISNDVSFKKRLRLRILRPHFGGSSYNTFIVSPIWGELWFKRLGKI